MASSSLRLLSSFGSRFSLSPPNLSAPTRTDTYELQQWSFQGPVRWLALLLPFKLEAAELRNLCPSNMELEVAVATVWVTRVRKITEFQISVLLQALHLEGVLL
eukprot:776909_1